MMKKRKFPYISQKKCIRCKKPMLFKRPADRKKKYCSLECRKIPSDTLICEYCKGEFVRKKYGSNRFCSITCSNKAKAVNHERICESCGKSFTTHDAYDIKRGHARYCSNECKVRKYKVDENYLSIIDSPDKAYILGYIFSSGELKDTNRLVLSSRNNNDLKYVSALLKSTYPIKENKNKICLIRFYNHEFVSCLTNNGFMVDDRKNNEMPLFDPIYNIDFVRGYFDGFNGFVFPKNTDDADKNLIVLHFDSLNIFEFMYSILGGAAHKKGNEWILILYDSNKFYNTIYNNAHIFLQRKKDKFLF